MNGEHIVFLRAVLGLFVLTSVSTADWTVEIVSCVQNDSCEETVNYVPGESFGVSITEPFIGDTYSSDLLLHVTSATTLRFVSAGSCECAGTHFIVDLDYFWLADDCYYVRENCVYRKVIEVQPGSYPIELRFAGYFSITNDQPTPEPVAGDYDGDADLDVDDYNSIGTSLGLCASDTNRDSIVDFSDLLMVINDWGTTCE